MCAFWSWLYITFLLIMWVSFKIFKYFRTNLSSSLFCWCWRFLSQTYQNFLKILYGHLFLFSLHVHTTVIALNCVFFYKSINTLYTIVYIYCENGKYIYIVNFFIIELWGIMEWFIMKDLKRNLRHCFADVPTNIEQASPFISLAVMDKLSCNKSLLIVSTL